MNRLLGRRFTWNVKTYFLWKKKIECRLLQILPRALRVKMGKDNVHETTDSRVLDISIDMNEVNKEFDWVELNKGVYDVWHLALHVVNWILCAWGFQTPITSNFAAGGWIDIKGLLWQLILTRFTCNSSIKTFYSEHKKINIPASILYKCIAGRYRPVSYPDGPITARYRFIKNAYWDGAKGELRRLRLAYAKCAGWSGPFSMWAIEFNDGLVRVLKRLQGCSAWYLASLFRCGVL